MVVPLSINEICICLIAPILGRLALCISQGPSADFCLKLYGLAFFLIGAAPYVSSMTGRGWTQNVATAFYAIASSSGSLFFALNFAEEGIYHLPPFLSRPQIDDLRWCPYHIMGLSSMRYPRQPANIRRVIMVLGIRVVQVVSSWPKQDEPVQLSSLYFDSNRNFDCMPHVVYRLHSLGRFTKLLQTDPWDCALLL